ncbi:MAG: DUF4281 domain-containing protein [Acidobacteria bacterium]|nr:DUF4281 domain-containing protein [Acidobacteriota bacterium]
MVSPETLFAAANLVVVPGWALLVLAPGSKWTTRVVGSSVLSLLLATLYVVLLAARFGAAEGGFGSLAEVATVFRDPYLLLAGWIHYLAFDLFVGGWEVRDARRLGLPHFAVVPCLVLTFVFGPAGLLAYSALRLGLRRRVLVEE